jgi:hypothetical protein
MPLRGDPLSGELKHLLTGLEGGAYHPKDGKNESERDGEKQTKPKPTLGDHAEAW